MKFRSYQLYLLVSAILLIAAIFMPVANFIEPDGATSLLDNFSFSKPDGTSSYVVCALGVVLSFTALVNVFALFVSLFQNFELQKRMTILMILLITGYYILLLVFGLLLCEGAATSVQLALFLPFIALILNVMCFLAVRRTEAKILARASGFRLRD